MEIPLFYAPDLVQGSAEYELDPASARHCLQVLRKREGDPIILTDGSGRIFRAVISGTQHHRCMVAIQSIETAFPSPYPLPIMAMPLTKNMGRFEWFLEKVVEIGVAGIIPLSTNRSRKASCNVPRLTQIMASAMLQSRRYDLPVLHPVSELDQLVCSPWTGQKLIAHCLPGQKDHLPQVVKPGEPILVLIGPEGDFTSEETQLAISHGFIPVALGDYRLRMETAGVVAAAMVHSVNLAARGRD